MAMKELLEKAAAAVSPKKKKKKAKTGKEHRPTGERGAEGNGKDRGWVSEEEDK